MAVFDGIDVFIRLLPRPIVSQCASTVASKVVLVILVIPAAPLCSLRLYIYPYAPYRKQLKEAETL